MSEWLSSHGTILFMGVPMLCYTLQGVAVYAAAGRYGMCLAMLAYATANIGLILDTRGI